MTNPDDITKRKTAVDIYWNEYTEKCIPLLEKNSKKDQIKWSSEEDQARYINELIQDLFVTIGYMGKLINAQRKYIETIEPYLPR